VDIAVREPLLDLVVTFSGGLRLEVFCDRTFDDDFGNYQYATPKGRYVVDERSVLTYSEG
jgi:hypothetical protein